jgi:hypothetical protein
MLSGQRSGSTSVLLMFFPAALDSALTRSAQLAAQQLFFF